MNLPTAMLPEEQVGWMFHRVCMKEASTWELPLAMERCCKKRSRLHAALYGKVLAYCTENGDVPVVGIKNNFVVSVPCSCQTVFNAEGERAQLHQRFSMRQCPDNPQQYFPPADRTWSGSVSLQAGFRVEWELQNDPSLQLHPLRYMLIWYISFQLTELPEKKKKVIYIITEAKYNHPFSVFLLVWCFKKCSEYQVIRCHLSCVLTDDTDWWSAAHKKKKNTAWMKAARSWAEQSINSVTEITTWASAISNTAGAAIFW